MDLLGKILFGKLKPKKDANFGIRPSDKVVEEEFDDEDDWHYIEGKIVYGHIECTDKECGWYGTSDEVECKELYQMITNGEVYTGKRILGDTEQAEVFIMWLCPDCGNHKLVFVPNKKKVI